MAKEEMARILRSSVPLILTYLLQYSFAFVNLLVLGRIGADKLAAAALANMTVMVVVNAPAVGLASALDTYCSTAFTASQDRTLVGFHLQRGIIAVTGHFLCIVPLLWHIDTLFIWLKQDPTVSHMCCHFMRVQLLGSLAWMYFECIKRYLQAQGHMRASTIVLLIIAPIHVVNNYVFVWSSMVGMGFLGAAFANVVTYWLMFVLLTAYAARSEAREAWGGWNIHALWTMPQYFKLAIPSMIMICSEWWILDLLALAASYLGSVTLAAQSIVINTCTLTYQFADGQSVALADAINSVGSGILRSMGKQNAGAWINFGAYYVVGFPDNNNA
ncbi:ethionine resistance protein [Linderina macrospora]|uniref:Ethionine resistance protein n=1 Tax=Linderina macrospora TaxID=4868 RepID=A0ACC1JA13_9FUNG|nr:ethionine resistance protein [Linderina macrospora]